jgi:DNA adenine methylase
LSTDLKAPFPWFGGKSRAAEEVSAVMGDLTTYCEPFAGSLAVLLKRPVVNHEVVNDADGWLVNFWRAVKADPEGLAAAIDYPVTEVDLLARHVWLVNEGPRIKGEMEADPDAYDLKAAAWWVWGVCSWIGSGWCSGDGPWNIADTDVGPRVVNIRKIEGNAGGGVKRKLPHLGDAGRGVNRGTTAGAGILEWMGRLSERLRRVRVTNGDFGRVLTPCVLHLHKYKSPIAGVLIDPPYPAGFDQANAYAGSAEHASEVWQRAVDWAASVGEDPRYRVVVCGYDGMWTPPEGWTVRAWKNEVGYRREKGQRQEVLWCSPHCIPPDALLV